MNALTQAQHVAGLLGGLLVRSLAVAAVPGIWLVFMVVGPLARLATVIAVVAVVPPAVLAPSAVCKAFGHIVATSS
jgi:hypothetical protein